MNVRIVSKEYYENRDKVINELIEETALVVWDIETIKERAAGHGISVTRWNFVYVDESFRDDYELAKIVLTQHKDPKTVYSYLGDRLKDDLSLALIAVEEEFQVK